MRIIKLKQFLVYTQKLNWLHFSHKDAGVGELNANILIFVAMFPWHSIPPKSLCSGGRFSALLL